MKKTLFSTLLIIIVAIIIGLFVIDRKAPAPQVADFTLPAALNVPATDSSSWTSYHATASMPFTMLYPSDWSPNARYENTTVPGKTRTGVSFNVPQSLVTGTNLGSDTIVSVEKNPYATACNASEFFDAGQTTDQPVTIGGQTWTMATTSDAGAGNRYEETVVSMPHTVTDANPCLGIRLFLHYSVLENYPEGSVQAFDKNAIVGAYEGMVKSFQIGN